MIKFKHILTCLLLLTLLGMPNFTFAKVTINPSETLSSSTYEFASVEESVNRLELELTEKFETETAECTFFRKCDAFKACLANAAIQTFGCAAVGFSYGAWWGAAIAGVICGVLTGSACSDEFRGAC